MKNTMLVLFLGLFCFSCGKSQTEIKGDVFIKSGDQVIKLAAVRVQILKKEKAGKLNSDEIPITDADYFATTDADGRFSVKIPNGEYVAAVDFIRDETEIFRYHYYWRVPFTANGGEKKIAFDPTNVQSTYKIMDLP